MLLFFEYFRRKKSAKNWRFWLQTKLNYAKNDHNIGYWEIRHFFRRKLSKIAENCDHNIDPRCNYFLNFLWLPTNPILPFIFTRYSVYSKQECFFKEKNPLKRIKVLAVRTVISDNADVVTADRRIGSSTYTIFPLE
jgi:hypothetical protein